MNEREEKGLKMLGLKLPTDPRWVDIQEKSIEHILNDHAFCEQKAASACISLIIRFWDKPELVEAVEKVVEEEWEHFQRVTAEMRSRNIKLSRPEPDVYVKKLKSFCRKNIPHNEKLLDELLLCAMIEARSCERFRLLSLYCSEVDLRDFYYEFMASEAGHYTLFIRLANSFFPEDTVRRRWQEFLEHEAQVLADLPYREGKMH